MNFINIGEKEWEVSSRSAAGCSSWQPGARAALKLQPGPVEASQRSSRPVRLHRKDFLLCPFPCLFFFWYEVCFEAPFSLWKLVLILIFVSKFDRRMRCRYRRMRRRIARYIVVGTLLLLVRLEFSKYIELKAQFMEASHLAGPARTSAILSFLRTSRIF